jgi:hypothetical protein
VQTDGRMTSGFPIWKRGSRVGPAGTAAPMSGRCFEGWHRSGTNAKRSRLDCAPAALARWNGGSSPVFPPLGLGPFNHSNKKPGRAVAGLSLKQIGHAHADVNGGGGSQTYIKIVPGRPRHKVPD